MFRFVTITTGMMLALKFAAGEMKMGDTIQIETDPLEHDVK
jgi:hypothetical protein